MAIKSSSSLCKSSWTVFLFAMLLVSAALLATFVVQRDRAVAEQFEASSHSQPLESPEQGLFLFANNVCSPSCCPSQFGCSGGCVCVTENQKKLLSGGGASYAPPVAAAPAALAAPAPAPAPAQSVV